MKSIIIFSVLVFFNLSQNNSGINGIYLCDNKLQLQELKILDDDFVLYHHSHVDGTYLRKGKVKLSGDTLELLEESNTIKSAKDLLPFYDKLVSKNEHLFVIFKNKKGKAYIQNSSWNYSKSNGQLENLTKPDWYKE